MSEIATTINGIGWAETLEINRIRDESSFDYERSVDGAAKFLQEHGLSIDIGDVHRMVDKINKSNELITPTCDNPTQLSLSEVKQILLDLDRTFPSHEMFQGPSEKKLQLFRILLSYVLYNPAVGYCQGMSYVTAFLLIYLHDEEEVFWCTVSLFEGQIYLKGLYSKNLAKMKQFADVFGSLLEDRKSKLAHHLVSLKVHPLIYTTSWFMCLYTALPVWSATFYIVDSFISDGYAVLFRAGLTIMNLLENEILALERIDEVVPLIQNPPEWIFHSKNFVPMYKRTFVKETEIISCLTTLTSSQNRIDVKSQPHSVAVPKRKRVFGEIDGEDVPLIQKLINAFTPAKKTRPDSSSETPMTKSTNRSRSTSNRISSKMKRRRRISSNEGYEMTTISSTRRAHYMAASNTSISHDISPFEGEALSPYFISPPCNISLNLDGTVTSPNRQSKRLRNKALKTRNSSCEMNHKDRDREMYLHSPPYCSPITRSKKDNEALMIFCTPTLLKKPEFLLN